MSPWSRGRHVARRGQIGKLGTSPSLWHFMFHAHHISVPALALYVCCLPNTCLRVLSGCLCMRWHSFLGLTLICEIRRCFRLYQTQLPASGVDAASAPATSTTTSSNMDSMFNDYVHAKTLTNWKFSIVSFYNKW